MKSLALIRPELSSGKSEVAYGKSKSDLRAADLEYSMSLKANILVLLHAYQKQSQKAPTKEIATAEQRLFEVMDNEKDYT